MLLRYASSFFFGLLLSVNAAAAVTVARVPDSGLQPRLVNDADGGLHLLYFKKRLSAPSAREGRLYYRQYDSVAQRFSAPVQVSSTAFDLQTFAIARASMALDGNGRAHVLWYLPKKNSYFYARSNEQRTAFETQRSIVSSYNEGLDAAGDIAARDQQVAIVWAAGALSEEASRTVYARFSDDGGATFGEELRVGDPDLGACACCSLATEFDTKSRLIIGYRSALNSVGRHMQRLSVHSAAPTLAQAGQTLRGDYAPLSPLQEWELSACPLSTNDFALDALAEPSLVFETAARVIRLPSTSAPSAVREPATPTRQKNPAVAINAAGQVLTSWGEAISHSKGGTLRAQLEDAEGNVLDWSLEGEPVIPRYSFPAAGVLPNGEFLLLW